MTFEDVQRACSCQVMSVTDGQACTLESLRQEAAGTLTLLLFFTHWADLGSWELAQNIRKRADKLQTMGTHAEFLRADALSL